MEAWKKKKNISCGAITNFVRPAQLFLDDILGRDLPNLKRQHLNTFSSSP